LCANNVKMDSASRTKGNTVDVEGEPRSTKSKVLETGAALTQVRRVGIPSYLLHDFIIIRH